MSNYRVRRQPSRSSASVVSAGSQKELLLPPPPPPAARPVLSPKRKLARGGPGKKIVPSPPVSPAASKRVSNSGGGWQKLPDDNTSVASSTSRTEPEILSASSSEHLFASKQLRPRASSMSSQRSHHSSDSAPIDVDSLSEYKPRPCDKMLVKSYVPSLLPPPRRIHDTALPRPPVLSRRSHSKSSSNSSSGSTTLSQRSRPIDVDTAQEHVDEDLSSHMSSHNNPILSEEKAAVHITFDTTAMLKSSSSSLLNTGQHNIGSSQADDVSAITKRTYLLSCNEETVGPIDVDTGVEYDDEDDSSDAEALGDEGFDVIDEDDDYAQGLTGYLDNREPVDEEVLQQQQQNHRRRISSGGTASRSRSIPQSIPEESEVVHSVYMPGRGLTHLFEV